jgi:hypothetical protein
MNRTIKHLKNILLGITIMLSFSIFGQGNNFPDVEILTLEGKSISSHNLKNIESPIVLTFCQIDDKYSWSQIMSFNDIYKEYFLKKGIKVIMICADNSGNIGIIKTKINGFAIDLEVFIDRNSTFKRAMNVVSLPFTIFFDSEMNRVRSYLGYYPGFEYDLLKDIDKFLSKQSINNYIAKTMRNELKKY